MSFIQRTHSCGELTSKHAGKQVVLNGWAHRVRDLGGVYFIDLRDRTGLVQLMFDPARFAKLSEVRHETCLSVSGEVRLRSEATRNPNLPTGDVEVVVGSYSILSPAKPLPFPISDEEQMKTVNEELRIKHRYLDLRRPSMYRKLALRTAAITKIRKYLDERDFLEVETPIITKSTPEGARDYLVPYRQDPGKFYALPQSPQQYKQLLMVSGIERYYQIAKCFRDESQRSDRQPEFTQLDLEMSFVKQEDVLQVIEGLTRSVINELIEEFKLDKTPIEQFPRLSYDESVNLYGTDKPDLRFDLRLFDVSEVAAVCDFGVFRNTVEAGGMVRGIRYPGGAQLSRKEIGDLETYAREFGAKGLATMAVTSGSADDGITITSNGLGIKPGIAKFFKPAELDRILTLSNAEPDDLLCFIADSYTAGNSILSRLRNEIGTRAGLRDPRKLHFCWVLDFPLVEWDATTGHWTPMHHPFTAPKEEDLIYIDSEPARIRADCYDIVCNGMEWASGSIRIHQPDVQQRVFSLIGLNEETQRERFGHMIDAFTYGAPPHGGIAPGIDRLVMMLTDDDNIREVMAFPKVGNGYDPLMDAPSSIDPHQWAELGIRLSK